MKNWFVIHLLLIYLLSLLTSCRTIVKDSDTEAAYRGVDYIMDSKIISVDSANEPDILSPLFEYEVKQSIREALKLFQEKFTSSQSRFAQGKLELESITFKSSGYNHFTASLGLGAQVVNSNKYGKEYMLDEDQKCQKQIDLYNAEVTRKNGKVKEVSSEFTERMDAACLHNFQKVNSNVLSKKADAPNSIAFDVMYDVKSKDYELDFQFNYIDPTDSEVLDVHAIVKDVDWKRLLIKVQGSANLNLSFELPRILKLAKNMFNAEKSYSYSGLFLSAMMDASNERYMESSSSTKFTKMIEVKEKKKEDVLENTGRSIEVNINELVLKIAKAFQSEVCEPYMEAYDKPLTNCQTQIPIDLSSKKDVKFYNLEGSELDMRNLEIHTVDEIKETTTGIFNKKKQSEVVFYTLVPDNYFKFTQNNEEFYLIQKESAHWNMVNPQIVVKPDVIQSKDTIEAVKKLCDKSQVDFDATKCKCDMSKDINNEFKTCMKFTATLPEGISCKGSQECGITPYYTEEKSNFKWTDFFTWSN